MSSIVSLLQTHLRFFLFFVVLFAVFFGSFFSFAEEGSDLRVQRYLLHEQNPNVIAFVVSGTFSLHDVVMLYSNDLFIKSLAINAEDSVGTKELQVDNISLDTFGYGVNQVVAKIERQGVVVAESPPFSLPIKPPPGKPSVAVSSDPSDEDLYQVRVSGTFEVDDSVVFFLNESTELGVVTVTSDAVEAGSVTLSDVHRDSLRIGENFFTAVVRRSGHESAPSDPAGPIVIQEPISYALSADQCLEYPSSVEVANAGGDSRHMFGSSVAAYENLFAVGSRAGYARLYHGSEDDWSSFLLSDIDDFGNRVPDIVPVFSNSDTVFVGVPGSRSRDYLSGAVHVYDRSGEGWAKRTSLIPESLTSYDLFGSTLSVDGHLLVVGSKGRHMNGSVYVYTAVDGAFTDPVRLAPDDAVFERQFGSSISVDGGRFAVGAPGDRGSGLDSGSVYVYTFADDQWRSVKLSPQRLGEKDAFGSSVLLRDNLLFVGAPGDDDVAPNAGAVYVYSFSDDHWSLLQKILPEGEGVRRDAFGTSLALQGSVLAIGVPGATVGQVRAGAVHVYRPVGDFWTFRHSILSPDSDFGEGFGERVAFSGLDLVVGVPGNGRAGRDAGSVRVFAAEIGSCADLSSPVSVAPVPGDDLDALQDRRMLLEDLVDQASSLLEYVSGGIADIRDAVLQRQERIVLFDESVASADAQRRAAESRGIIGPTFPEALVVEKVVSDVSQLPAPTSRSRGEVVRETRDDLGIVAPIAQKRISIGDVDEEVYRLQVFLNENGYLVARSGPGSPGEEVNQFGPSTERALKSFQLVNGVAVTGVLDRETRNIILTYISEF